MLLLALLSCREPLLQGELVEEDWAVRASQIDELLEVPCADLTGGDGPYEVLLDEATGTTVLLEAERAWIRGPFGLVSDRCWWLPDVGAGPAPDGLDCVFSDQQDGQCTADQDWPEGWEWSTPGAVDVAEWSAALAVEGTLLMADGATVHRLDLTPSHHDPVDEAESARTYRGLLPDEELEHRADAMAHQGELGHLVWDRDESRLYLRDGRTWEWVEDSDGEWKIPQGEGVLGANSRSWIFAVEGKAELYFDDEDAHHHRTHRLEPGQPLAAASAPDAGLGWILLEDGVQRVGWDEADQWWPTPGAQGLLLGRPDGPIPYAWGNEDGLGVLYRLEPDGVSVAWRLDEPLLGAGIGDEFQEIALVTAGPDGPHVTSWLDRALVDAVETDSVGLALAAFAETPRDGDYADVDSARSIADKLRICGGEQGDELVCCVHAARGQRLEHNLQWLGERLQEGDMAAVLGLNPTTLALSERCQDTSWAVETSLYPEAVDEWIHDHTDEASLGLFVHSAPYTAESWWVRCPDEDPEAVPERCWKQAVTEEDYTAFYELLVQAAALEPWTGREGPWRFLGGGYEGASVEGVPGWTDTFPELILPDGLPADRGLYFGLAGMDPRVSDVATKEMSPLDARQRPWMQGISLPPADWNAGGSQGVFWPGPSFALNRVHELGRSGLRLAEWTSLTDSRADWTTERYPGDEDPELMTRADFLALEHLIVTRNLALGSSVERWWTLHLQDLASLHAPALDEGWMDCSSTCDGASELDRFAERLQRWTGRITWSPVPP